MKGVREGCGTAGYSDGATGAGRVSQNVEKRKVAFFPVLGPGSLRGFVRSPSEHKQQRMKKRREKTRPALGQGTRLRARPGQSPGYALMKFLCCHTADDDADDDDDDQAPWPEGSGRAEGGRGYPFWVGWLRVVPRGGGSSPLAAGNRNFIDFCCSL